MQLLRRGDRSSVGHPQGALQSLRSGHRRRCAQRSRCACGRRSCFRLCHRRLAAGHPSGWRPLDGIIIGCFIVFRVSSDCRCNLFVLVVIFAERRQQGRRRSSRRPSKHEQQQLRRQRRRLGGREERCSVSVGVRGAPPPPPLPVPAAAGG